MPSDSYATIDVMTHVSEPYLPCHGQAVLLAASPPWILSEATSFSSVHLFPHTFNKIDTCKCLIQNELPFNWMRRAIDRRL